MTDQALMPNRSETIFTTTTRERRRIVRRSIRTVLFTLSVTVGGLGCLISVSNIVAMCAHSGPSGPIKQPDFCALPGIGLLGILSLLTAWVLWRWGASIPDYGATALNSGGRKCYTCANCEFVVVGVLPSTCPKCHQSFPWLCPGCRYPLWGLKTGQCPECGLPFLRRLEVMDPAMLIPPRDPRPDEENAKPRE